MKARVLVAVVCVPIIFIIIYLLPPIFTVISISVLSVISVYELLCTTKMVRHGRILAYSMIFAAAIPVWCYFGSPQAAAVWGLFCMFLLLFVEALAAYGNMVFEMICAAFFASVFIPFFLSSFIRIMTGEYGKYYILLPFVVAFISDAGAYFVGISFGKHKLMPEISPKKTIEGAMGGFAGAVLGTLAYGLVIHIGFGAEVNYLILGVYGVLGSLVSQLGDLSFSMIKRQYGIKDFGFILPGHGGVLDRFDSVIFAAPLIEILIFILPAISGVAS